MRQVTGQEGDNELRRNYDFLTSIDTLILDQAEAFYYQNIEHLEEVLKAVNKFPKKLTDLNDISRIKEVYADKLAPHLRQTIVVQKFRNLDLDYITREYCQTSLFGNIQVVRQHTNMLREMSRDLQIKFTLKRLNVETIENQDDVRFNFFTKKLWQSVYSEGQNYTVLFVPQYFDFVKLRHFIK